MSNEQSVWPDGAREAVEQVVIDTICMDEHDAIVEANEILTALEPFVQQRIAARQALELAQFKDFVRRSGDDEIALRAEVARLREDRERLDWLEKAVPSGDFRRLVDAGKVPSVWPSTVRGFIDAARSAPGGEG